MTIPEHTLIQYIAEYEMTFVKHSQTAFGEKRQGLVTKVSNLLYFLGAGKVNTSSVSPLMPRGKLQI